MKVRKREKEASSTSLLVFLFLVCGCFPPISMSLSPLWHGGQLRKEFYGVWRVPAPAQPLPDTHPLQAAFVWAKWGWMHPFNFDFHSLLSCIDGEANSIWACFTWCHAFKRHMLSAWRGTTLAEEWTPKIMKRNITLFMTTLCGSYLYLKSCFMCSQGCRSGRTKPCCTDGGLKHIGSVCFLNCINACVYFTFKTQSPLPADHSETLWTLSLRAGSEVWTCKEKLVLLKLSTTFVYFIEILHMTIGHSVKCKRFLQIFFWKKKIGTVV